MDRRKPRRPRTAGCGSRRRLLLSRSSSGAPRAGHRRRAPVRGRGSRGRLRKFLRPDVCAPGPARPAASQPAARSRRRAGGERGPGTVPGSGGAPAAPLPPPGARTHRASLGIPRWRPRSAARPEPEPVAAGRGSRSRESGAAAARRVRRGASGGACTRRAARAAVSPRARAGLPRRRRGLYRRPPGPRPFLPPPPPARPAPPSRRRLCVRRPAASPRPHPGTPRSRSRLADAVPRGSPSWGCAREAPGDAQTARCGASRGRGARGAPGSGVLGGGDPGARVAPRGLGQSSWLPLGEAGGAPGQCPPVRGWD